MVEQVFALVADHAAAAIETAREFERVARAARTDALTGLGHHGAMMTAVSQRVASARRGPRGQVSQRVGAVEERGVGRDAEPAPHRVPDGGHGLRVQELKVSKGKDDRLYHVNLVLVQVLQHDRSVKGDVEFSLQGAQDGVAATYTLAQLVPEDENGEWPFSFRYFQNLDRRLILPDGFTPEKVNIEIRSRTKSVASVSQSFLWQSSAPELEGRT